MVSSAFVHGYQIGRGSNKLLLGLLSSEELEPEISLLAILCIKDRPIPPTDRIRREMSGATQWTARHKAGALY